MHLSSEGIENFDEYSDSMMISTLNYAQHFPQKTAFAKMMTPETNLQNGEGVNGEILKEAYVTRKSFNETEYDIYYSNIMIHRFLYQFIDSVVFFSNERTLEVLYGLNALITAITVSCLLVWLKSISNSFSLYIVLFGVALFSPNFAMIGTNLYWASWSLFLPIAISALFVINRNFSDNNKTWFIAGLLAFISCLIKQLLYFEFLSSVMIAMMIPYIAHCIHKGYNWKKSIKYLCFPFIGAILSFFVAIIIKLIMLVHDVGSISQAFQVLWGPISYRLLGEASSSDNLIRESANANLFGVLLQMESKPALSIKNVFWISQIFVINFLFLVSLISYYLWGRHLVKPELQQRFLKLKTSLVVSWISLLSPLSWFILAKPHTVVHHFISCMLWFIPFSLIALSTIILFFTDLYLLHGFNAGSEKPRNSKRVILYSILIVLFVLVNLLTLVMKNADNMSLKNRVISEGIAILNHEESNVYFYNNQLFFIKDRGKDTRNQVFVHVIPSDKAVLSPEEKKLGFSNLDFSWNSNEVPVPFFYNFRMASRKLDVPYAIDRIELGQFDIKTGERTWEENVQFLSNIEAPTEIFPAALSDDNWKNGISVDGYKILLGGDIQNYKTLLGRTLLFINNDSAVVTRVDFFENWVHLTLDHQVSYEVGNPNKIRVQ
jgi:hypothetical protein